MEIIDYARPTMMAEKALKDMHNAVLEKKYDEAKELALEALTQVKLAYHSICVEQDNVRKAPASA